MARYLTVLEAMRQLRRIECGNLPDCSWERLGRICKELLGDPENADLALELMRLASAGHA